MKQKPKLVVSRTKKITKKQRNRGGILGITPYETVGVRLIPSRYLTGNEAVLDLDCEEGIEIGWKADDYTTIEGASRSAQANFEAPATHRNDAILEGTFSDTNKPITTQWDAWLGYGDRKLMEGSLSISRRNLRGKMPVSLDMVLTGEGKAWANQLADLRLNELPFRGDGSAQMGEVVFSEANIFAAGTWGGNAVLKSQTVLSRFIAADRWREYVALPVNYGFWGNANAMTLTDLRLWFFELDLLQLAFGTIGYRIVSRFMNSDYYRKDLCYILRENYFDQDGELGAKDGFLANWVADTPYSFATNGVQVLDAPNDSISPAYDANGNYNGLIGEYTAPADMTVQLACSLSVESTSSLDDIIVKILYSVSPLPKQSMSSEIAIPTGGTASISAQTQDINILAGQVVTFFIMYTDAPFGATINYTIKANSFIQLVVKYKNISDGDTLKLANIIDPELTALDVLKGAAHRYNWRFETDADRKTVTIEPAWNYNQVDDAQLPPLYYKNINGFYGAEIDAVTIDKCIDWCGDHTVEGKKQGKKRRLRLTYKDADPYYQSIKDDLVTNGRRLFDAEVYLGDQYEEGVTIDENPFYAATANAWDSSISTETPDSSIVPGYALWIPHIWTSVGEAGGTQTRPDALATRITPRVVKCWGLRTGLFLFKNIAGYAYYLTYPGAGIIDANGYRQTTPDGKNYIYADTLSYGSEWGSWYDQLSNKNPIAILGGRDIATGDVKKLGLADNYWLETIEELKSGIWETFDYIPLCFPYQLQLGRFRTLVRVNGQLYRIDAIGVDVANFDKPTPITLIQKTSRRVDAFPLTQPAPPVVGLRLTFLPGSPELAFTMAQWNTFFNLPTLGVPFTSISITGTEVTLLGGSGISLNSYFTNNTNITGIFDDCGCIASIVSNAFFGTTNLTDAVLNSIPNTPNVSFANSGIVNGSFTSATNIGFQAFYNTANLGTIALPNALTIGTQAFSGSGIVAINTPVATSYGQEAFAFCYGLTTVNGPLVASVGNGCFNNDYTITNLSIPLCTSMGASSGGNNVFDNIFGSTMILTVSVVLQTNNGGLPDGDIQSLLTTSPGVTVIYI